MEYLLKTYTRLKRKERKGFTLVELLVVIAILAVLASVSVVGYLGFTNKAKNSNALTELSQAKEVIRAELIEGSKSYDISTSGTISNAETATSNETTNKYTITFNLGKNDSNKYALTYSVKTSTSTSATSLSGLQWNTILKACFTDLNSLSGKFNVVVDDNSNNISSIKYFSNGGNALWTVASDELKSGDQGEFDSSNTISYYVAS